LARCYVPTILKRYNYLLVWADESIKTLHVIEIYHFHQGKKGKEQVDISEHFLKGMAIARPSIRFMLRHNQKLLWQHAKADQLKSAIASAYSSVADMLPFGFTE